MLLYDISKTNFIIISKNNINYSDKKNGIKINIKGKIPKDLSNNQYLLFKNINNDKLKNRVIFSGESKYNNNNLILLTQQNLNHNIKLVYKKDPLTNLHDLNQPRIIFKKYSIDKDISFNNQYLFTSHDNSLKNIQFQNQTFNIHNLDNFIDNFMGALKKIIIGYNVYQQYENSNFFKFNFNDFINTNTNVYNDISKNLFIKINDISCNKDNNNFFNNISYENIYKIIDNSTLKNIRSEILNNKNFRKNSFINSIDFFNKNGFKDLLLHPQEHCFTLKEIENCILKLNLKFCGFLGLQNEKNKFKSLYGKNEDLLNLKLWKQFENDNPKTFLGMYHFCVQKI